MKASGVFFCSLVIRQLIRSLSTGNEAVYHTYFHLLSVDFCRSVQVLSK